MELKLVRSVFTSESTIGKLYVDGKYQCHTLEDMVREGPKVMHKTAIPAGRYRVRIGYSPRFKKKMPRVEDVPGFSGILIHVGNDAGDSSGCILVGQTASRNFIGGSRLAFNALFKKLEAAAGPIWLSIDSAAPADS
ncbi:DUF5675 family protein [Nannocystis sp. SCPEA4]|uniref:DUF5675 family protein n=1 Tax=Nannocystis sp. SCPEA4 TaxID=2996787 RepID=UPI00226D5BE6|nr:DUF5675 family protein [Nannocystis sp. SCPEA4]MCY1059483.1 DUF5675 family protein [Nannocystis sp. SCPEA4]